MSKRDYQPYLPFLTLLKKEILRFLVVSIQTIITPIISASLYLLVFGLSLGSKISLFPQISYVQFIIPGLIFMGVANNSFANTSSSIFFSRYIGNIVDLLVTPITPTHFILAYTVAAILRGLLVGLAVLFISFLFTGLPWASPLSAAVMILLASFLFAQFGIIAGIYCNTFDNLAMYNNFLILPLIYTGGLFSPVSHLPGIWQKISRLNPLTYLIDGFRQTILGIGDTNMGTDFLIASASSLFLFLWAWRLIQSGHKIRT